MRRHLTSQSDGRERRAGPDLQLQGSEHLVQGRGRRHLHHGLVRHRAGGATGAAGATFTNGPLGLASSSVLSLNTSYVRDPSGTLVSQKGLLSTHYYLFDRLGSVVALTDGSGNAVNRYHYDPYGNRLAGTVEAVANPWQFAGGFRDAFSGYTKFGERYYDPAIGRWTQRDPSGMDANSYGYAGANPVNFVDLTGLAWWHAIFKKGNDHLVLRDLKPGLRWNNHSNRIEWQDGHGWHYNKDGKHLSVWKGVRDAAKTGARNAVAAFGRFAGSGELFIPVIFMCNPDACSNRDPSREELMA